MIDELVDVDSGCMRIIENKWMPERLSSNVVGLVRIYDLKQLLIKLVGLKKVRLDL